MGAVSAWFSPAGANEDSSGQVFNVDCPALDAAERVEVEARARVEALLAELGPSEVTFACNDGVLSVEIVGGHWEGTEPRRAERASAGGELASELVELFVAALSVPRGVPLEIEPEPPLPAPRSEKPIEAAQASARDPGAPRSRPTFSVDVNAVYESLGSQAFGALGFEAALLVRVGSHFAVGPFSRGTFGVDLDELSLAAVNLGLRGELRVIPAIWIAAGPQVSLQYYATASSPRARGNDAMLGGFVGAGTYLGSERAALRAGLHLNFVSDERIIRVDSNEILSIPALSLLMHLGGRFGFGS